MAQDVHVLYAMSINGTVIDQIQDQNIDTGLNEIVKGSDGNVDPTYSAIMEANPRMTFSSTQVGTLLGVLGINGLAIASNVVLYWQKTAEQGIRAGTLSHISATVAKGLIVPRQITASQGGEAVYVFEVILISSDGVAAPLTFATGVTLPAGGGVSELFTLGPLYINGAQDEGVQSTTLDFGINEKVLSHSGHAFPIRAHIESRSPSLRCTTTNVAQINTLGITGAAQGATDSVAYLRKMAQAGVRTADLTAEHISFTVDLGIWKPIGVSGGHPGEQTADLECRPTSDESNAIVAISTTAAIP